MKTKCTHCHAPLIDDYWDIVEEEQSDGTFVVDVYETFVCENRRGYYWRKKE